MRHLDETDHHDRGADPPGVLGIAGRLAGAGLALALIGAAGLWGWRLIDRDPADVPIIRAQLGPTKEVPADPGGEETPHLDVLSYRVIEEDGAPQPAPRLRSAPAQPGPDDLPMERLAAAPAPLSDADDAGLADAIPEPELEADQEPDPAAGLGPDGIEAPDPDAALIETTLEPQDAVAEGALAEIGEADLPAGAADAAAHGAADGAAALAALDPASATATAQAPAAALTPRPRPGDFVAVQARRAAEAEAERQARQAAASTSPVQIQLGAFPDEAMTRAEWARLSAGNGDLLGNRALAVQTTVSGGTTWYRLRVGPFRDRAEAATVCQALKARRVDCLVAGNG